MKKLELKKETVARLSKEELDDVRARGPIPCWENIWTLYECGAVYTGPFPG